MCGIFGVLADKTISRNQELFIKHSTLIDQLRGEDGTGILTVNTRNEYDTFKRAVPGCDFYYTSLGSRAWKSIAQAKMVLGHNRKGTSGGGGHDSCHPFEYENLVGVHNGTLTWSVLRDLDTAGHVAEVDSAKLYAALNKAKDPIDVLTKINAGSYALVWMDINNSTLNFVRNSERPLWFANGDGALYWGSEPGMIAYLMSRHNLNDKKSKLWKLPEHSLHTISIQNPTKFTKREFKPETTSYGWGGGGVRSYGNRTSTQATERKAKPAESSTTTEHKPRSLRAIRPYHSVANWRKDCPSMTHIIDDIEANVNFIRALDPSIRNWDDYIDVCVCRVREVKAPNANTSFPEIWGYMQDSASTQCDPIPVKLVGCAPALGLLNAVKDSKASYVTVRARINAYNVHGMGMVSIVATPLNVWDDDENVPAPMAEECAKEIEAYWGLDEINYTSKQIDSLWEELAKPLPDFSKIDNQEKES